MHPSQHRARARRTSPAHESDPHRTTWLSARATTPHATPWSGPTPCGAQLLLSARGGFASATASAHDR